MDELGLSMSGDFVSAPNTAPKEEGVADPDDLLQKRLDNLKNDQ